MKKIDLEILDIALSGSSSGAYALVLGEVNGKRKLPIVIGGAEAQSIAIELENMRPSRPLTHECQRCGPGAKVVGGDGGGCGGENVQSRDPRYHLHAEGSGDPSTLGMSRASESNAL